MGLVGVSPMIYLKVRSISNATIVVRGGMSRKNVGTGRVEERTLRHQPHKVVWQIPQRMKIFCEKEGRSGKS
ncbi:hypothetical protein LR48_Vigan08g115700 [Vigna angularis]|uniref:Uncharacterized protein n=1 Tax=Phaseolus angularis TaxID=3914 RepID=A0A0L9V5J4_PHAAN|nr:hypothetical protein LR48_Vigan08g115700 [Vigna angularis]